MIQDASLKDLVELSKYVDLDETYLLEHFSEGQLERVFQGTRPFRVVNERA